MLRFRRCCFISRRPAPLPASVLHRCLRLPPDIAVGLMPNTGFPSLTPFRGIRRNEAVTSPYSDSLSRFRSHTAPRPWPWNRSGTARAA
jgi:hypothetical protein